MNDSDNNNTKTVLNDNDRRETFHKEIDLIEAIVARMAHNSFLVKGWTLSVMAFVFTLNPAVPLLKLVVFLFVPVISFWWLDAFYLRHERAFRTLYEERRVLRTENGDWKNLYDLNDEDQLARQKPVLRTMLSPSVFPFYFVLLVGLVFLGFLAVVGIPGFSFREIAERVCVHLLRR